jgi:hypothetical protein
VQKVRLSTLSQPWTDLPMALLWTATKKNGDLFVLNTYKDKLCIKMIRFTRKIDCNLHHQHNNLALVWNTIWIRKNRFHLLFRMEFLTNTIWKIQPPSSFLIKIRGIFHGIPRTFILIKCKLPYNFKFQFLKNSDRNSSPCFTEKLFIYQICILRYIARLREFENMFSEKMLEDI